mmetsp:Transcript_12933/g.22868  ORF Transcript_12933/g.22868 Transcript_12933/m.22868 type:complete len:774 (-) Transcript_12933:248-2569(-)
MASAVVNGAVMAGGAAAGAAVVTAGYKAHHGIQKMATEAVDAEEKKRYLIIRDLMAQHLENFIDDPESLMMSLSLTHDELNAMTPVPQAKQAFDAILMYQLHSQKTSLKTAVASRFAKASDKLKPSHVACEIIKNWLRMSCENQNIHAKEVEAYRDFCAGLVDHWDTTSRFVTTMSHVAIHLDAMLKYLLQERRESASQICTLRTEAYHFVLHAVQVLLLAPTTCVIPSCVYSMDSLGLLYNSTLPGGLLSKFEKEVSDEMAGFWRTDCGRLLLMLLRSPHGSRLCAWMDGQHSEIKTIRMKIRRATNLPQYVRSYDEIDPYVSVVVVRQNNTACEKDKVEKVSKVKTMIHFNNQNPEWEEQLTVQIPVSDNVSVHFLVKDYDEMLGGLQKAELVGSATMTATKVAELAAKGEETELFLNSCCEGDMGASLHVAFHEPCIQTDSDEICQKWLSGDFTNSGLQHPRLSQAFMKAVKELDSLVYFFDVMFSQCLEITSMLGDLGMVLCARFMRPLIDELEERIAEVETGIMKDLLDICFEQKMFMSSFSRNRSCGLPSLVAGGAAMVTSGAAMVTGTTETSSLRDQRDPVLEKATHRLRMTKDPMLQTLAQLRLSCLALSATKVLEEAHAKHRDLMKKLQNDSTSARSSRFKGLAESPRSRDRKVTNAFDRHQLVALAESPFEENDSDDDSDHEGSEHESRMRRPSRTLSSLHSTHPSTADMESCAPERQVSDESAPPALPPAAPVAPAGGGCMFSLFACSSHRGVAEPSPITSV